MTLTLITLSKLQCVPDGVKQRQRRRQQQQRPQPEIETSWTCRSPRWSCWNGDVGVDDVGDVLLLHPWEAWACVDPSRVALLHSGGNSYQECRESNLL